LENKFKVIYAKDNSNPLISLQLYIRVGSAWEKREEAGFSHFTEHLVFKSTRKFPANQIMEKITFLGGQINAYTEYDSTCFYLTLPAKYYAEGLEILAEIGQNANFNETEFQSEKSVVIEELKQINNNPEEFFVEKIAQDYFTKNRYKNPIIGNLPSLQSATKEKLMNFYHKYYIPENSFLVVAGDFQENRIFDSVNLYFGSWKRSKIKKIKPENDDFPVQPKIVSVSKKISNELIAFVFPDVAESHPDSNALYLAFKAFAIGKNSILYQRLFNREQLIDHLKVHSFSGKNNGAALILIMPKKGASIDKIIEITLQELNTFHKFGLTETQIEEKKKEFLFSYKYSFEYVESLASSLGNEEILTHYANFLEYPQKLRKISVSDVMNVIRKYFSLEKLAVYKMGTKPLNSDKILQKINRLLQSKHTTPKKENFREELLPNGIKLIFKKVTGKPTIGISADFEISQLNETIENRGINLFSSGLLLYGNEKRDYRQFLDFCHLNGINFGIHHDTETTAVSMKCFRENLYTTLELFADVYLTPIFPNEYLQNLKSTYISNLDRMKDYPEYWARYLWKNMIFGKNSNLVSKEGKKSDIRKVTLSKIKNWYREKYLFQPFTLTIVGNFDFERTSDFIKNLFAGKKVNKTKTPQNPILSPTENRFRRKKIGSNQAIINLGNFACNALETEKNTAFHVLAQIIGGDTNSILFQKLREEKGLAYSVGFSFKSIRQLGFYVATAIVDKANEDEAIDLIKSVLSEVKKNGISDYELQKTKNFIRGQRLFEEESMLAQAQTISSLDALGFGYEYYLKREERLKKVNRKILQQLANQYFNDDYFIHILF
ncbi:MAG: hypothetical protein B6D62_01230, partial [Candidatus Cloacimonas sp. 4484_275]